MSVAEYRELAPDVQLLMDAGAFGEEYARTCADIALVCVGFITHIASAPEVVQAFGANDREHFVEGFQGPWASWLRGEFAKYLAAFQETEAPRD
jgi:hypothetical protein